jgi:hypothetical protein
MSWFWIKWKLLLKVLKNRRHSWTGHTIRHNELIINLLEGAISAKKGRGKTSTTTLKASRQKHSSWQLYSNEENGLQQIQMESCQPIKRLKNKNKKLKGRANGLDKKCCHFYRLSSSTRCCSIYCTPLLMALRSTSANDKMSEYSLRYNLSVVIFAKLLYGESNMYSRQRIHIY